MNQLHIDITADSRKARQEFDALSVAIDDTRDRLDESTTSLDALQTGYRGLSESVLQSAGVVDLERQRQQALDETAHSAEAARDSVTTYLAAWNGTAQDTQRSGASSGALQDHITGLLDQVNDTLGKWIDQEAEQLVRQVKTQTSAGSVTLPADLTIQNTAQPRVKATPVLYPDTSNMQDPNEVLQKEQTQLLVQQLSVKRQLHDRELELDGQYDQIALERLQEQYDTEMSMLLDDNEAKQQLTEQFERRKEKIQEASYKRERQRQQQMVAGISTLFGNMAKIAESFGKRGFETWKHLSSIQAMIDGIQAVQSAFAWGMKFGGPVLAAVCAGVATGVAAANVAAIESQSYADGGLVSARVSNGEYYVDPATAQAQLPLLAAMRSGLIRGRGTGRSDSIPALLPSGSYILPARAVSRYGAVLSSFAEGGEVGIDRWFYSGGSTSGGVSSPATSTRAVENLLTGIHNQLRAVNVNLASNRPVIRVENHSRNVESIVREQDYTRRRMQERGYDGRGENLAL